jgi:hypothetical protein
VVQNRVKNLQRDLDAATQAKGQFDALAPAAEVVDASAEIAEVEGLLAKAKADRQAAENKRLDIAAAQQARDAAEKKTRGAPRTTSTSRNGRRWPTPWRRRASRTKCCSRRWRR